MALQLSVAIDSTDWDALQEFKDAEPVGHQARVGAILELQLFFEKRALLRHWTGGVPARELELLGLAGQSQENKKILSLRPESNMVFFEGEVTDIVRRASRADAGVEVISTLIDCGAPIVFHFENPKFPSSPELVTGRGERLAGICMLFAWISTSSTLVKAPIRAKVLGLRHTTTSPQIVMLTVERVEDDAPSVTRLWYSWLDEPPPIPKKYY